jgi:MFS family permease
MIPMIPDEKSGRPLPVTSKNDNAGILVEQSTLINFHAETISKMGTIDDFGNNNSTSNNGNCQSSSSSSLPTQPLRHDDHSALNPEDSRHTTNTVWWYHMTPKVAFILVSLSLGELGDGLNIFQGIYLVGTTGWNEGNVGLALSLMGFTALLIQPFAGNWIDQTTTDRRLFLIIASAMTALSASTILFVRPGNYSSDHALIFISKVVEGISASFIGPCIAALTLANFGPQHFDTIMASNILWNHIGSVVAAVLAGLVAYVFYPNVKYCFFIIAIAALCAIVFVPFVPQGDPFMGRGFHSQKNNIINNESDETGNRETLTTTNNTNNDDLKVTTQQRMDEKSSSLPIAATYYETMSCPRTILLCLTGLFFQYVSCTCF